MVFRPKCTKFAHQLHFYLYSIILLENESLLADRKELISQIEALKLEKENLVSVIFSMEILIMYGEQSKPADFRSI